ncbi:MAG: glycerophosphoryl diester phosphodiesterase [Granulosicoccus sp.]|jgi:glycerophosphoryl diester phosphodiesterase
MTKANGPAWLATVIAHRGASGDAPENTNAALTLAADHGATCVEIDVSISSDRIPFVHHDDTLDRCTNGSGLLSEQSAESLDLLDASKGMNNFAGEPLPRLSSVIDLLIQRSIGLNLEIKPQKGLELETVDAICNMIESDWPSDLPLVFSSFSRLSLELAKKRLPDIARGLLVDALPEDWQALIDLYECRNIHCDGTTLSADQARVLADAGLGVYCYTVNDPDAAKRLLASGVHGVFTDYPQRLMKSLEI